jgi:predicted TIM-barrel fold metal-dependent hydrolase
MKIKFGLISCDSHGQLGRDAFTSRMSQAKWGDRIPQVVEITTERGEVVDRWSVNGKVQGTGPFGGGVVNCPAAMGDPSRRTHPKRWEEVPKKVYDPIERLGALDEDGVDAEVLYPNNPLSNFSFPGEPEYELACVQAYNDAITEYRRASDRYVPIAIIPYRSPVETIVAEVTVAATKGAGGIVLLAEPSLNIPGVPPTNDPFWEPLWAACQELDLPISWHGSAGLAGQLSVPAWDGYTRAQAHTTSTSRLCTTPCQLIPNLLLSGRLERYPRLKWVFAETGMGWINYVLESCDHEWERRQLWKEGLETRPSELFRRQIYVDFWFERAGIEVRRYIGLDNIMWESDYPHVTSTYPESWDWVERVLPGVSEDERRKMLYGNAMRLYKLEEN